MTSLLLRVTSLAVRNVKVMTDEREEV